jgi:KUP system potassium uptake protein
LTAFFLTFDLAFLGANAMKIEHGGWVPLAIALVILALMTTWKKGRDLLGALMREASLPLDILLSDLRRKPPLRVSGTAVFLTADQVGAPVVLLHHLKHNKALHDQVVLLSITTAEVPAVEESSRVTVTPLEQGFFRVKATYGFMETPSVQHILDLCAPQGLKIQPMQTSYFLNRERLLTSGKGKMARWRKELFVFMSRNAQPATQFFGLPPNRVVELGAQMEL